MLSAERVPVTTSPEDVRAQISSNNPAERLHEVRRHTDAVGVFPSREAIIHLVAAVLAEQVGEWDEGGRHLGLQVFTSCRFTPSTTPEVR